MPSGYKAGPESAGGFSEMSFNQASSLWKTYGDLMKICGIRLKKDPEMEVFLDDYIMLPDMEEVFFELLRASCSENLAMAMRSGSIPDEVFYKDSPGNDRRVIINDLNVLASLILSWSRRSKLS